jgi:hypothetical protein
MTDRSFGIAALFVLPFLASACQPISTNGEVANSANTGLPGCTTTSDSCNDTILAGVVADIKVDPETQELTIRFVQLSQVTPTSFTYSDGRRIIDFTGAGDEYDGPDGEEIEIDGVTPYVALLDGLWDIDFVEETGEAGLGIVGYHTDAGSVPTEGGAFYTGTAQFGTTSAPDLEMGSSILLVDFEGKTADLLAGPDTDSLGFDYLESLDMAIDGYAFTGDTVTLYDEFDAEVNITGENTKSASAGMFFGPIDVLTDAPEQFGAIAIVTGDDDILFMRTIGGVVD